MTARDRDRRRPSKAASLRLAHRVQWRLAMELSSSDVSYALAVARRIVGASDAEDVAQEALLRAFVKRDQFEGRSQVRSWLYRITVNSALALLRARRRDRILLEEREPADATASPEERLAGEELGAAVRQKLALLRPAYREVVALRYEQDRSEPEVARALGITVGMVKIRGFRARRELRALMAA